MNFKKKSSVAFVSVVGFSFLAAVSARADIGDAFVLCKHDKMVRTLRVDTSSDLCKAIYTKQGVDQVIGSAQNKDSCQDFLSKVRKNLEEGKWTCRDVKESRVSNLGTEEVP